MAESFWVKEIIATSPEAALAAGMPASVPWKHDVAIIATAVRRFRSRNGQVHFDSQHTMVFELVAWCQKHCTSDWRLGDMRENHTTSVIFASNEDAMLFLMSNSDKA